MSFFHEPPPLDCDIPPPLDEKLRDTDFELEDEDNIIDEENISRLELPELPTDFNVFSSTSTDDNLSYSHKPPDFESLAIPSSLPPDGFNQVVDNGQSESPCDVAKEKESFKIDVVVSPHELESIDKQLEGTSIYSIDDVADAKNKSVTANENTDENTSGSTAVSSEAEVNKDIPAEIIATALGNVQEREQEAVTHNDDNGEQINDHGDSDDFNEFVAGAKESNESADAFKTEELLGEEHEDILVEAQLEDIAEPIPELNLDEDQDDDFNDFETAIPVNRQVESYANIKDEKAEPAEFQFEADFSAFNAFTEPAEEKSFEEFQEFKATGFDSKNDELKSTLQDNDDDFGDFNDFTQASGEAPALNQRAKSELQSIELAKTENVISIIEMMFTPTTSSAKPELVASSGCAKEYQNIESDNFVSKFKDFDSMLALGYLYTSSKASQSLVKALGIDTRNILHGPQWASSLASSNMPRYAANLSFSPIEPLKPSSSQISTIKSSTDAQLTIPQPTKAITDIVPEAEFDWNSSGLVNPLDGAQPKPQQPHDVEPIIVPQPASTHSFENESPFNVVDQEVTQVFETEAKANAGHKPELSEAYQWSSEAGFAGHLASSNVGVRERTIKLPETHIFTPVKGSSPVAREVTSRDASPTPADDAYFPKGPITVKEYHDVEYSLEPKKRLESDGDFDDFQSAQPAVHSSQPLSLSSLLEPETIRKSSTEIMWPEPGSITQSVSNDLDFLDTHTPSIELAPTHLEAAPTLNFNLSSAPSSIVSNTSKRKEQQQTFTRPIIGTSPTEQNGINEDDDFNDFQAAPPQLQKQPVKLLQSNDPITLSPARLVATANKHSNQQSSWISSMDNDEINRIEAAFPKCKTEKKSPQKSNGDEDDWSDFVGASQSPASHPFPQPQPPSTISSNAMNSTSRFTNGESDDWSDFVSVPPPIAKISSSKSIGAISSQLQSKPNFSSWNQPISKPYVNHSTSFLTKHSGNNNQQFTSNNHSYTTDNMPRPSMTITNNFNYNFNHSERQGEAASHHQRKPNGISTILPELDFAMPKNLINMPRGGQLDPGKK